MERLLFLLMLSALALRAKAQPIALPVYDCNVVATVPVDHLGEVTHISLNCTQDQQCGAPYDAAWSLAKAAAVCNATSVVLSAGRPSESSNTSSMILCGEKTLTDLYYPRVTLFASNATDAKKNASANFAACLQAQGVCNRYGTFLAIQILGLVLLGACFLFAYCGMVYGQVKNSISGYSRIP